MPHATPRASRYLGVLVLIVLLAAGAACSADTQPCGNGICVTTIAGGTSAGYLDGPAASARFQDPQGVAVAPDGTVYVADTGNNRIRRIAPDGTVTTVAGDGSDGGQDGPAASARFSKPWGIAVDAAGTLYVSEPHVSRVRKITPDGSVTTVLQARNPVGLAVGADGTLYVAAGDLGAVQILTVSPSGTTGRHPGSAAVESAVFLGSPALAIDAAGVLYVAGSIGRHAGGAAFAQTGYALVALQPDGQATTLALPDGLGVPADWERATPEISGLAVTSDGTLYLTVDCGLELYRRTPDGGHVSHTGDVGSLEHCGYANGAAGAARFGLVYGAASDRTGAVYVVEAGYFQGTAHHQNSAVRKLTPQP